MTDTLMIILSITQIFVLFIIATPLCCKLSAYFATMKNPDWVAEHPEMQRFKIYNSVMIGCSYLIAAASMASVIYFVLIISDPTKYILMLVVPSVIWINGLLTHLVLIQFGFSRKIPSPRVVSASMSSRDLTTFIPTWLSGLVSLSLGTILTLYIWAFFSGAIDPEIAIRRVIGLTVAVLIGIGTITYMLRRKHSELDKVIGEGGRRWEIIASFHLLSTMLIFVGVWRILGDFYDVHLFQDEIFFICVAAFVQVSTLFYGFHPKVRSMLRDFSEKYELLEK